MAHLSLWLLGAFRVAVDGKQVPSLEYDKVRALLAYLALESDHPHRREALAGLLWPDLSEHRARRNLSQALFTLRSALGAANGAEAAASLLTTTPHTIQLADPASHWIDARAFLSLLSECRAHVHRRIEVCRPCLERLEQAVGLYKGELMPGFSMGDSPAFEEWQLVWCERLHRMATEALGTLALSFEQHDAYSQAEQHARKWTELDPWDERAHCQLMRVLALNNQRHAALAQYRACRTVLAEELGVEPARETVKLYEQVRDGVDLAALSSVPPNNLPLSLTPFVGREKALVEIESQLCRPDCRLLTLVGPGGIGKTRLALETAREHARDYRDGVFFVPLASLQSANSLVPALGMALGFAFYQEGDPKQQLLDYLRGKEILIALDSFEQLVDPAGTDTQSGVELLIEILQTAPEVRFLVTSRVRMNAKCEHTYVVRGMDFPGAGIVPEEAGQYSAVTLFAHGARRVQSDFELDASNLPEVSRICRLVGGMPLAILLAAAWVDLFSPSEIAAEMEGGLGFLQADWRDVPERHRSIRAVFDHSWSLLTESEQDALASLSVFCGGFARDAAQEVAHVSTRDLAALVSKSMVQKAPASSVGGVVERFEMHELLRQYAAEKLERSVNTQRSLLERYTVYYAAALQRWEADLRGARQQMALTELDIEIDNAHAAWDWAVAQVQVEELGRAVDGLCHYYQCRARFQEGESACQSALVALSAETSGGGLRVRVKTLAWQGVFCWALRRSAQAGEFLERCLALLDAAETDAFDSREDRAFILMHLADMEATDSQAAVQYAKQSVEMYNRLDHQWGTACALRHLGQRLWGLGDYAEARMLYEKSLALHRSLGDPRGTADALWWLGFIAVYQGQIDCAQELVHEALATRREMDDRGGTAEALNVLGVTHLCLGEFRQGLALLEESLRIFEDLGQLGAIGMETAEQGLYAMLMGEYEQARACGDKALALLRQTSLRREVALALFVIGGAELAGGSYGKARHALGESAAIYREIEFRDEESWALAGLGYVARSVGDLDQMRECLHAALQRAVETKGVFPLAFTLPGVALFLADRGQMERAVEVYALVSQYPLVAKSRWFEDIAGRRIAAAAADLPRDMMEAAQERGRARNVQEVVAELLAELDVSSGTAEEG